jgi:hypothetical protein
VHAVSEGDGMVDFGQLESSSASTVAFELVDLVPTENDCSDDGQNTEDFCILGSSLKIHGIPFTNNP